MGKPAHALHYHICFLQERSHSSWGWSQEAVAHVPRGLQGTWGWCGDPKVAVSRALPLAVQRRGGGQGAPVAEGGGGGVRAVAVHAHRVHQALLGGDCSC